MAFTSLRLPFAAALLALTQVAFAQASDTDMATSPALTESSRAFALDIDAPTEIKQVLERHLELQRYRVLADLSDSEIQSLMLTAEQDARELIATLGYFSPTVTLKLEPAKPPQPRRIRLQVAPGAETRVRAVRLLLQGPIALDETARVQRKAVLDGWSLPENEIFSQSGWDDAKQLALKQLLSQRYAAAQLTDSKADIDPEAASAALEVTLDSGPAYKVGRLTMEGQERYGEDLVRRLARLKPGEDYAQSNLVDAQKRLTDSGYFDSAYLRLDLDSPPENAVVHAQVKESAMQKLVLGVGASTDSGARWSAEHTYNQVPGIGWRAVNKIVQDQYTRTFSSDWTAQPGDNQWRWAASALLGQSRIAQIDVNTQRYRFGRFTSQADLDQNYYLQFERAAVVYLENSETSANEAATANYAFSYRQFDSIPFPSRGWGVGGEMGAGTILGSQQEPYARALLHIRAYQPLENESSSLFHRQRSGRMVYRAQVGAVLVDKAANVPFNQLFLTGGDSSVRGYLRDEIGVTHDGILSAVSGRYMANASIEWQRPIVRGGVMTDWEGALFLDTGAVSDRPEDLNFKMGVGMGARWKSPIGPLQLDLAYGMATEQLRLHLNVGFIF